MISDDLQIVCEDYPGKEPEDMERRMKKGFSMFSNLTMENFRSLGIPPNWVPDIKIRLGRQGFDVKWQGMESISISRRSQLKLQQQGC